MYDEKIFPQRLKGLRIASNLSQGELGKIIGVKKSAISDIENGRRTTTFEKLYALADYFDVSTDYLLGRTDEPKVNK